MAKAASGKSTIVEVVGLFKNYDYHHVSVVSLTLGSLTSYDGNCNENVALK